jgi:FMN-dependent NADH-azoreductase
MSLNITRARRQFIEDYRKDHPAETLGYSDVAVEAMAFELGEVSTEALVHDLHRRGYTVALEVG